jgi:UDP-N-acetylglucosamine acyltransferase
LIHSTAIVDASACLADDCEVGAYSIIGAEVEIGAGCTVGPHVVLKGPTRIGERNRIYPFASVGEDPQDLKYDGEPTRLEIGDDNIIREYVTLNRGTAGGGGVTRIGDHNLFMAYIHVAHDCQIGNHTVFANGASLAGHVNILDHAILAGFACVHQFCTVGEHAFVGLNSVANRDVAPFMMVVGNYAVARGINKNGLRRRGFSDDVISALHKAYMVLVRQRGDRQEAVESLRGLMDEYPEVARFVSFIEGSERGIVR